MNYSLTALILLLAYMWHSGTLLQEVAIIKRLLVATYEIVQVKFDTIINDLHQAQRDIIKYVDNVHNTTLSTFSLVVDNSKKIDVLNDKIDIILQNNN